jgi:carbon-monoxide dehydrogenase large subunit
MGVFGTYQSGARLEDARLLTGRGRYVDDIVPEGALFAVFVRAPLAHARIRSIETAAARVLPGVQAVLTADDLLAAGVRLGMKGARVTGRNGVRGAGPERPVLARGVVRHAGEAVAVVVADTLAAARDAAEAVEIDYDDLPAVADLLAAREGPTIHAEAPGNLAFDWGIGDEAATAAAFAAASHRVALRVVHNRVIVASMEPRGAWAEWQHGRLHLCVNGQGVWEQKQQLAAHFGLAGDAIRVTNPDVGGGFGMKSFAYPEYVALAEAARQTGRPVRWMSDRSEAMLSDTAGRDLVADAELAFDADLRITGYRVNVLSNLGAYNSQFGQPIQSELFAKVLTGVYDIPAAWMNTLGVYTNTVPVDAYRGAGRPEAIYTLERAMDEAARVLGVDPFELRARNFVRRFPYRTPTGELYDVGDFPHLLERARAAGDAAGFPARRAASAAAGRLRGLGLCYYIESILGAPEEHAAVEFRPDGRVALLVGTQSNGQGHETVYTRFLAANSGIAAELIDIVQGDSDRIPAGGGTGGSRSVTVQTTATLAVVEAMVAAFRPFVAQEIGADAVTFEDGAFRAPGSNRAVRLVEAAELARAAGRSDLLTHRVEARIAARSYPNGAHLAEVEIDPETGVVEVVRYTVVDDFGTLVAPQLVEGQVHGGVAQGIGQALCENAVYDGDGQLLSGSFMDYALPRADMFPPIAFDTLPVPSTGNPLGMKGCGEAGTVGSLAAVTNAVRDALAARGVGQVDMPCTPARVWQWLEEARAGGDR